MNIALAATVSVMSLLGEMLDRDAITRFPEPSYRMKLFSSYDRASTLPGEPNWDANADFNQFLRIEENAGREERVLVDADGPGALVRFWFAGIGHDSAILRVYVDGAAEPAIEGAAGEIAGGEMLAGWPLSAGLSPDSPAPERGINLYLPIPFARHVKVTAEITMTPRERAMFYYNIETRLYARDTEVESFSKKVFAAARTAVAEANEKLAASCSEPPPEGESASLDGELKPGESRSAVFKRTGAIRYLRLKSVSPAEYSTLWWQQQRLQLRKVELEITFDGKTCVSVPVGEFFNTGLWRQEHHETRFTKVGDDGVMESRWVMPFAESCEVRLTNKDEVPVVISDSLAVCGDYAWDGRSMHFGTTYVSRPRLPTRVAGAAYDIGLDRIEGKGVIAGTAVTVENTVADWWGEGDEKIWVDGEASPSYIGTGTEDHFGYAWCKPAPFSHPFLAQPTGEGNLAGGYSVNFRARILDAIPFEKSIRYDIEIWHWSDTLVDYDSVSFHYLKP